MGRSIHMQKTRIPHVRRSFLPRPRLMNLLSEVTDYPLSVVKAGAGYGKTTAIAHFAHQCGLAVYWITLTEELRDPVAFVSRLLTTVLPSDVPDTEITRVLDGSQNPLTWAETADWAVELVSAYVHHECLLVFDDFHVVDEDTTILQWLNRWFHSLPVSIHVVFVTRTNPSLPYVETMSLHGEVLAIRDRDLAFTESEIAYLFNGGVSSSGNHLPVDQVSWLKQRTSGMALVLAMLWREWEQHHTFEWLQSALDEQSSVRDQVGRLFLSGLKDESIEFFRQTSVLNTLSGDVCDYVLQTTDSSKRLKQYERKGYVVAEPDGTSFTLHPLLRDHLVSTLPPKSKEHLLWRVVQWYVNEGHVLRAIGYLFSFPDKRVVARELLTYIPDHLSRGQVSTVQGWLDRLPADIVQNDAHLLYAAAEVSRFTNDFSEALARYERAASVAEKQGNRSMVAQTHIGRSRLYLDTIQPRFAAEHIRLARRWTDANQRNLRWAILQVCFENAINQGRLQSAGRLQRILSHADGGGLPPNNSDARLLLRTGRLTDAVSVLKARVSGDQLEQRTALSHREGTLLLALLHAMRGEPVTAQEQALRGYSVGDFLHAPFVRAVGYIRLGHAQHVLDPLSDGALSSYQQAVQRMDEMAIPRGKSEALLGLCLAYGYRQQVALARACAEQGISTAEQVGDIWMASLVRIALGQVLSINGDYLAALEQLNRCESVFRRCGDVFLLTATMLWRAIAKHELADSTALIDLDEALRLADMNHHEWIFLRPTLFGLKDMQQMVPVLLAHAAEARSDFASGTETAAAGNSDGQCANGANGAKGAQGAPPSTVRQGILNRLLDQLTTDALPYHPGYTLRIQTLGTFRVWRGFQEVPRKAWQREKSRQLFQYFLTRRGNPLHREEIAEQLWGDIEPDNAERDFKVALNGLSAVIEPGKPGRGTTVFIQRSGQTYELTTLQMLQVDRDEFLFHVQQADYAPSSAEKRAALKRAIDIYGGDYLPELRYETWVESERDRLRHAFIQAATQYARLCLQDRLATDVITACDRVLQYDPAWEEAYVLLMQAYGQLYNRGMVVQTFRNCTRALREEYGVEPTPETRKMYEQLAGAEK